MTQFEDMTGDGNAADDNGACQQEIEPKIPETSSKEEQVQNGASKQVNGTATAHPLDTLRRFARESGVAMTSEEFARRLDDSRCDSRRDMFSFPKMQDLKDGESCTFHLTTRILNS